MADQEIESSGEPVGSRAKRLIAQVERVATGGADPSQVDRLLTECVAEMLSVRAQMRRLQTTSDRLELAVGELRALRDRSRGPTALP